MNRIFLISLLAISFCTAISAQSGRRAKASPTPAAVVKDDASEYSESKPQPKRPVYLLPSLRSASGSSANSRTVESPVANDPLKTTEDGEEVISIETDLVTIPVSVFDRNGLYIPNLQRTDFKIFEDGKEQEIAYFGTSDKPFTVILLIDVSPSTAYKIEEIRNAAISFVDQLKTQDQVMVIEFDSRVNVLVEATGDRQKIYKAINKADFGEGTSIYNAVDFSLKKRLSKVEGRKAIVLFTDGVDTTSRKASYDSTLNLAEESDAMIFPIYYNTFLENSQNIGFPRNFPGIRGNAPGTSAGEYAVGKKYLEELASYTGGRVFRPESTPGGLRAAFEGIAEELRRQYSIGYVPADEGKAGQRKQIRVRVNRPNLVLRTRDSYIVGSKAKPAN